MREKIINFLSNFEIFKDFDIDEILEKPKDISMGDFAIVMFKLSSIHKKNPMELGVQVTKILNERKNSKFIEKIENSGAYVNFFLNKKLIFQNLLNDILSNKFFNFENSNPKKIVIEWPSPNTNKALHIGASLRFLDVCFFSVL